jgi:hypothetical protein
MSLAVRLLRRALRGGAPTPDRDLSSATISDLTVEPIIPMADVEASAEPDGEITTPPPLEGVICPPDPVEIPKLRPCSPPNDYRLNSWQVFIGWLLCDGTVYWRAVMGILVLGALGLAVMVGAHFLTFTIPTWVYLVLGGGGSAFWLKR